MATTKSSLVSLLDDFNHRPQQNFQGLTPSTTDGSIKLPFRYVKNLRRDPTRRNMLMQTPVWQATTLPNTAWQNSETGAASSGPGVCQQFMDFGTGYSAAVLCNYLQDINTATKYVIYGLVSWPASADTDSHKQCLLIADNAAAFATLNDTFDVVIDAATTFKWRINSGSWTAGVTIAAHVTVGTYYDLYFQPDALGNFSAYNIADAWQWRRDDSTVGAATNITGYNTFVRNNNALFFIGTSGRVYVSVIGSLRARTVGYFPVYGTYLSVFYDHLLVGSYSATGWSNATMRVGGSDLNNYDDFFERDTNEVTNKPLDDSIQSIVTGLQLFNNNVYIATLSELYRVDYVGLPNVFEYVRITQTCGGYLSVGILGLYVAGYNNDIVIYDGVNFQRLQAPLYVGHNMSGLELSWYGTFAYETEAHLLHFDEVVSEFFIQKLPYTATLCYLDPLNQFGTGYAGGNGVYYTAVNTTGDVGITIDGPEVRTSLLCVGDPEHVVEIDSVWIDALLGNAKTVSLYYKALPTATGDPGTWTLAGTYSDTQFQQRVECRFSARYFAFRLVLDTGTTGGAAFAGMSAYVYGVGAKVEK